MSVVQKRRYIIWCVAVFLSALGNALPVFSDAGAAPWSAACVNIGVTTNLEVGTVFNILSVGFFTFNKIYTKEKLNLKKDGMLVIFIIVFGLIINLILSGLYLIFPVPTNKILGGVISLLGTACVAAALDLFIRTSIIMLPIDDFIKNLTKIFKDNVILSGLTSFGLGILFAVMFGLYNGEILAINYITIINFFIIGYMIDFFHKRFYFIDDLLKDN